MRTIGLPQFWAHGVCFGHVITMRSPIAGDFNAREVATHELAHAYHLQMTGGRVPRWLTEGLAELEAMHANPTLAREIDEAMAVRFLLGGMTPICTLSSAFTEARSGSDLLSAYMQARIVAEWLDARGGADGILGLLQRIAVGTPVSEALRRSLGLDCAAADGAFHAWLKTRLSPMLDPHPFVPPIEPPPELLARALKRGDVHARLWAANLALSKGRRGRPLAVIGKSKHPVAKLIRARLAAAAGRSEEALVLLDALVTEGHDGYQVQASRARALAQRGEMDAALEAQRAAVAHGPPSVALLTDLEGLLAAAGHDAEARALQWKRAELDEHNGALRQSLLDQTLTRGDRASAERALALLLEVRPLAGETWDRAARIALLAPRDCAEALRRFDRAHALGASPSTESRLLEAECRIDAGEPDAARHLLRRLLATNPKDPKVQALKERLRDLPSSR